MKKLIFAVFFIVVVSCQKDDTALLTLPSELDFEVTITGGGSGKVSVTATATNANYYTIFFGDSNNETGEKVFDGKAIHAYTASGIYTVRTQAHVTQDEFISLEKTVTIVIIENIPTTGATSPLTYAGKTLLWQDEFDGTALNTSFWKHELGNNNGWGNNELQFYRQENTQVKGGFLIIKAKKENFQGSSYNSSRINTSGLKSFTYGRIDIRAALPKGQGIWPALWMLGQNIQTTPWPACGEIDIMEMIGGQGREKTVFGTAHWDNNGTYASFSANKSLASGILADEFHVYSIVWTSNSIIWYLDNVQYHAIDITPTALSEFRKDFFFLFNIAVGGTLPGNPDGTTPFPQTLIVDYVRVFQ